MATIPIRTAPGLAEQVYRAVLDEICDGALAPGASLVQEQLAERFGVSRQPIQQAMALLKADGLVEEAGTAAKAPSRCPRKLADATRPPSAGVRPSSAAMNGRIGV